MARKGIGLPQLCRAQVPLFLEDGSLPARSVDEQVEGDYNRLLDECNDFRDNLGELSDNISLGVAMQHFWEDRCAQHAEAFVHGIGEPASALLCRAFT